MEPTHIGSDRRIPCLLMVHVRGRTDRRYCSWWETSDHERGASHQHTGERVLLGEVDG